VAIAAGADHSLAVRACFGDLTGDGQADLADYNVLLAHLGTIAATYTDGDLDHDTDVDLHDFALLANSFGNLCP